MFKLRFLPCSVDGCEIFSRVGVPGDNPALEAEAHNHLAHVVHHDGLNLDEKNYIIYQF